MRVLQMIARGIASSMTFVLSKPPAPAEGSAVQVRTFPETTVYVK